MLNQRPPDADRAFGGVGRKTQFRPQFLVALGKETLGADIGFRLAR